jgi:hypothetical protein
MDRRFPKRDPAIEAMYPAHLLPASPQMLVELLQPRTRTIAHRARDDRRALATSGMNDWSDGETDEPLIADHRNFYKVQKWSTDE